LGNSRSKGVRSERQPWSFGLRYLLKEKSSPVHAWPLPEVRLLEKQKLTLEEGCDWRQTYLVLIQLAQDDWGSGDLQALSSTDGPADLSDNL